MSERLGRRVIVRIIIVMSDLEEGLSSFGSVEEELEYWKRKSLEYCERSEMLILTILNMEVFHSENSYEFRVGFYETFQMCICKN